MRFSAFFALLLVSACAFAAGDTAEVNINSLRNPELKRYRLMSKGLDAFDEGRRQAPDASLKFQLIRRGPSAAASSWDGTTLRLAGNESSIPVPVEADGKFALARIPQAYEEDADLVSNHPKGSLRFSARVRTPGLAPNVVRLGDKRLECQVEIAIIKPEMNFMLRGAINTLLLTSDWCSAFNKNKRFTVTFRLDDWALSAQRIRKGQREPVAVSGRQFRYPFHDTAMEDDTLYEFEYWSSASPERKRQFVSQRPIAFTSAMDKWKSRQALIPQEDGLLSVKTMLKEGKWKFRLASPQDDVVLGGRGDNTAVSFEVPQTLEWHGSDLVLEVPKDGAYTLSLDLRDLERPLLKLAPNPLQ